jgi:DNA-binding Lrp family transcriptional regulator
VRLINWIKSAALRLIESARHATLLARGFGWIFLNPAGIADSCSAVAGMKGRAMVTAIILMKTAQGRTPEVAQALTDLPGISEAYSVAGSYDLVAIARVRDHEQLADLVSGRVQKIPGIESTNTLIAFRAYSKHDLEAMWDVGNEGPAS